MDGILETVLAWVAGALAIGGAIFFLVSAVALYRVRDGLSKVNSLGPATAVGLPMVLIAAYIEEGIHEGWSLTHALAVLLAVGAAVIVSSIASNALGRATYRSGAPLDPQTDPNELRGR